MTRYLLYFMVNVVMQLVAWIVTPLLPAFAEYRFGLLDNANSTGIALRLPVWLSWFDTPDNGLDGDSNWREYRTPGYWNRVAWLYRNSLYGFHWTVLSAPMTQGRIMEGDPLINYHTGRFGTLKITMGDYWQWKRVGRLFFGYVYILNFGWLLDDASQKRALFMFSPRWKNA